MSLCLSVALCRALSLCLFLSLCLPLSHAISLSHTCTYLIHLITLESLDFALDFVGVPASADVSFDACVCVVAVNVCVYVCVCTCERACVCVCVRAGGVDERVSSCGECAHN